MLHEFIQKLDSTSTIFKQGFILICLFKTQAQNNTFIYDRLYIFCFILLFHNLYLFYLVSLTDQINTLFKQNLYFLKMKTM